MDIYTMACFINEPQLNSISSRCIFRNMRFNFNFWLFVVPSLPTLLASSPSSEGLIPFPYQGETFQTYFKAFGDVDADHQSPLIVLHGGPGLTHDYLLPFADIHDNFSRPVIFYDQIGNGKSTHLRTKPASFWSIDLFVSELMNLINHFQIQQSFTLVGHSWGGILGSEFAVQKQPKGLKRLILTDSLASSDLWAKSNWEIMQAFPKNVQEGLLAGMTDPPKFAAALDKYYAVHGCRVLPLPEEYVYSLDQVFGADGDPTAASTNFTANWTIIDRLHLIKSPTLVINGRFDVAQDFVIQPFVEDIQGATWVKFQNSSHTPFWEERESYFKVVGEFLVT